ncbi:hypothetical protein [Devosia lucknowensis]|nr:hypothetical protein [Devosia lucknowensis]
MPDQRRMTCTLSSTAPAVFAGRDADAAGATGSTHPKLTVHSA